MARSSAKTAVGAGLLDAKGRRLLLALSVDGRQSAAALAKQLGLSRQAVAERIRDLERRGVIRGYRADVDPAALGLSVRAQIRLTLDGSRGPGQEKDVLRRLRANELVRSGFRVSGEDCFVAQVVSRRRDDVTKLLRDLQATRAIQSSRTALVLETVMKQGAFGPVEGPLVPEA